MYNNNNDIASQHLAAYHPRIVTSRHPDPSPRRPLNPPSHPTRSPTHSPTHQASKPFKDVMREEFPDYLTPVEERRVQKLAHMRRRGKGPPKKGEGKRAGKKKK